MKLFYIAMAMTIVANLIYHIAQKSTPSTVNPLITLSVSYLTAMVTAVVILPFYPTKEGLWQSLKGINWTSFALGIAIFSLEMGFLLAYRSGWQIQQAAVFSNVAVTLLLVPVGIWLFREQLSWNNILGVILCIVGLYLIHKK